MVGFFFALVLGTLTCTVGVKKILEIIFYILSLNWLLVIIIKLRLSGSIFKAIEGPLKNFVENDEEMAKEIADSDND